MKTKIIWIIDGLGPGGAEQLMTIILKFFDSHRFEMRVCALQDRGSNLITNKLEELGIPVDFVLVKHLRDPFNIFRILKYLRKHKPRIIHTQLEFSDTLGNIAAKLLGIPSVSTVHTIENPTRTSRTFWRNQIRWFVLRNFCTRIIAVSDKTRAYYIQYANLPNNKIITLYNGIDLSAFQPQKRRAKREARKNLDLPDTSIIVCTVAVLREQKGIQYMIEALPAILEQCPNVFYLIIGDGAYGQQLKSLASGHDVGKQVIFAGYRTDIPELLSISDLFVLPTLGDALPTVLIEAMAARIPIVASNVGGVPEIIVDKVTGLLVPPANSSKLADACLQILHNEALANHLVLNAYEATQQKFNVLSQVKNLSNLYEQMLND